MIEFFQMLYADAKGYVPVVRFPDDERTGGKPWKEWRLNKYEWFQWPEQAEQLVAFCESRKDEDLYVTVGVCERRENTKDAMLPLNVLHCDADTADPGLFALEPSMQVVSSRGRSQLYWALKGAVTPTKAEWLAKRIAYSQRDAGADTGWQMNKLMRVPGTTNTKPEYRATKKAKAPVVTATSTGRIYTFKELKKAFKDVEPHTPLAYSQDIPKVLPSLSDALMKVPASAMQMYNEVPAPSGWNPEGSWYKVLHKLACSLFRADLTPGEVFVVLAHSKANKYERDGRSNDEMWPGIWKARDDVDGSRVVFVDIEDDTPQLEVVVGQRTELLTPAERELLEPTFIDRWVEWAGTNTDADPKYHVVSAMTLLSTLLSEYGYAYPRNGALGLEMWFMTLGATTLSRKTTAASFMIRALDRLREYRELAWQIPMDLTPEALNVELGQRGEISSIWHVDEAHGMIGDSKGGKGYMHGMIRLLTQLYDGWVPGRGRASKDAAKSEKSRTHLTLHLMGVPSKMIDALTIDDFHSGFLARFIFVLGRSVELTPENMRMSQGDPTKGKDTDPTFDHMIDDLGKMHYRWAQRANKTVAGNVPIMFEDDAWDRWNQAMIELTMLAKNATDPEAVIPTADRTSKAVIKLACLLAMAEDKKKVKVRHVLTALSYAEEWFDTSVTLASMVTKSYFERDVDEIIEHIGANKRTVGSVYRSFQRYKFRDFYEMLEAAANAGRIMLTEETRKNAKVQMVQVLRG